MFTFKRNCVSIPRASLTGENMASKYCVKPHYTEQGCSLSSRFLWSTPHLSGVQWGQDEILYVGATDRMVIHCLLHSCCFWASSWIHLAGQMNISARILAQEIFLFKGKCCIPFHCNFFFFPTVKPVGVNLSGHVDNIASSGRKKVMYKSLASVTQS